MWNAHALPRERPLARRATPRILTYSQEAQRGERPFSWQPLIKKIHSTGMLQIARMAASLVACLARQTALLASCLRPARKSPWGTGDLGHSHVRSTCKQTLSLSCVYCSERVTIG